MGINSKLNRLCKWTFLFAYAIIAFFCNIYAAERGNDFTLYTINNRGRERNFTINVEKCIWLEKSNVSGKVTSIEHQGNCVEVHKDKDCKFDYITLKPSVPASLERWNLNHRRNWIDEGAKAVAPCRDNCNETNISFPEPDKTFQVTFYSETEFRGQARNVTIKGCKVIPKPLRENVSSLKYDGSFCVELHGTRDCTGNSIRIPKDTPKEIIWDLKDWGFDKKAIAVSRCGYNCSNSSLKYEKEEFSKKRWIGPEDEIAVTFYSEPDFQGMNQTYMFNSTEFDCFDIPDDWIKNGKTESIQVYNFCIDVFGKDTGCDRIQGEYIRLNYSEEARDIIGLGLTGKIKSIAPCPKNFGLKINIQELLEWFKIKLREINSIQLKRKNESFPEPKESHSKETSSFMIYFLVGFIVGFSTAFIIFLAVILQPKFLNRCQNCKEILQRKK